MPPPTLNSEEPVSATMLLDVAALREPDRSGTRCIRAEAGRSNLRQLHVTLAD